METTRNPVKRFFKWEYAWLLLIVIVTLVLHFMIIAQPAQPLFDEQHYVPDARAIIFQHLTNRGEHPPLAKLLIAGGIEIFGDNQYGWRIPSIVFGTLGIIFFYLMCRRFNLSRRAAVLGTLILATENLYFVQAGIAMLDIFVTSFSLLAFWLYARHNYALACMAVALATLCKYTGLFAIFPIIIHWFIYRKDQNIRLAASLMLSGVSFFLLMAAFDAAIYQRVTDFLSSFWSGMQATGSLTFVTAAHPSMSRPWEWIFNLEIMSYNFGPHFIGLVSFSVWALTVPIIAYMTFKSFAYRIFKSIKQDEAALFGVCWIIGTYVMWIPLSLITNRVSFIFYFLPTVPAICLGLGKVLDYCVGYWLAPRKKKVPKPVLPVTTVNETTLPAATEPIPEMETPSPEIIASAEAITTGEVIQTVENTPPETISTPQPLEIIPEIPEIFPEAIPVAEIPILPGKWWRKGKLQWAAISFVVIFFMVHFATFIIVAPPLNNWPIQNWFP
jgi:dolichyl-phosphate-mannose-protein mannosyltransferase